MIDEKVNILLENAYLLAKQNSHEYVTSEHIFYMLLSDDDILSIMDFFHVNISELKLELEEYFKNNYQIIKDSEPIPSVSLDRVTNQAVFHAKSAQKTKASIFDILIALYDEEYCYCVYLLKKRGIQKLDIVKQVVHHTDSLNTQEKEEENSFLKRYTINLNNLAKQGKIDPLIGRSDELHFIMQTLCRRKKNNPLLIGESGVGKTAIVEGLALAINDKKVPDALKNFTIYSLDTGSILAGTKYRGDFEKRLKGILKELKSLKNSIIFIDEIHTIVGAGETSGGSLDMSNLLKPSLASGELRCIGASTYGEFRNSLQKDKALLRRFCKIDIDEPSIDDTIQILQGLKSSYEGFHGVKYSDEVVQRAVKLSKKYLHDRFLPDSAIDLLDEVGASFNLSNNNKKDVAIDDLEFIVSKMANLPQKQISSHEVMCLKDLEKKLKQKIFGQNEAITTLVSHIKQNFAGLSKPNSPMGAFLFSGQTGVGKTEIAKQLAHILGIHFERFDMSEYMEKHSVSRLVGAPPGYVGFEDGGLLTEAIKKYPYCVLLLDEIEKAHEDLINILLQVFDNASLTDNNGVKSDFRNVIVIMTSNLGTKEGVVVGFKKDASAKTSKAIKDFFAPEFINRLDAIVQFNPLSQNEMMQIVDKILGELNEQLKEKSIKIIMSKHAKQYLAKQGYSDTLGARVVARLISEKINIPLSDEILFGQLKNGGIVKIGFRKDRLTFTYE